MCGRLVRVGEIHGIGVLGGFIVIYGCNKMMFEESDVRGPIQNSNGCRTGGRVEGVCLEMYTTHGNV